MRVIFKRWRGSLASRVSASRGLCPRTHPTPSTPHTPFGSNPAPPQDGALLGCQATGFEGVDKRVDVVAALIQKRGTVFDLEEAELCYGG